MYPDSLIEIAIEHEGETPVAKEQQQQKSGEISQRKSELIAEQ